MKEELKSRPPKKKGIHSSLSFEGLQDRYRKEKGGGQGSTIRFIAQRNLELLVLHGNPIQEEIIREQNS